MLGEGKNKPYFNFQNMLKKKDAGENPLLKAALEEIERNYLSLQSSEAKESENYHKLSKNQQSLLVRVDPKNGADHSSQEKVDQSSCP